jgi:hypothetical protein
MPRVQETGSASNSWTDVMVKEKDFHSLYIIYKLDEKFLTDLICTN